MADFTKKAIRDAFIKLLKERPLKQISVRDIVEECGINRNTFYYHYDDIPQLLESIVQENADRILHQYPRIDSMEECLNAIIGFSMENRAVVMHIYKSVSRDIYEQYQWQVCEHIVTRYVDGIIAGRAISSRDRNFIIAYVKCVSFGLMIGWLENGLSEDVTPFCHRICELKSGDLVEMIEGSIITH